MEIDVSVVGAGIWGCTLARRLAEAGRKVLVLEKRAAVGGNCRCEIDPETGIEIHTYGSHIFHTHNRQVWDFVRRFTEFNGYQHKVLARTRAMPPGASEEVKAKVEGEGGRTYHLPLGLTLINKFFDVELKPDEVEEFLTAERRQAIFDAFFRGYTSKQWGKPPEEIDPSIIKRVPVRNNYDTNYFNDYWQGIPADGYNKLFDNMLDHPNITLQCNCELVLDCGKAKVKGEGVEKAKVKGEGEEWINSFLSTSSPHLYYSGPIDALFGYKFGALPWRSLRFERETLNCRDFQGTSVVNYTEADVPYTRIHEFKHYHPEGKGKVKMEGEDEQRNVHLWGFDADKTIIMREYSKTWEQGDEPYYPISNQASAALLKRYQDEAARISGLVVGGRLGQYKYYDMDQAMAAALEVKI